MQDKPLLIFGLGTLAEQALYYFREHAGRRVVAFTVEPAYATESHHAGLPVLAFDEAQRRCPPASHDLFVAVGYSQRNRLRERLVRQALALGYTLPSFVHDSAVLARNVRLGANCLVRELAVVSPYSRLGDGVVVGMQVGVSHHVQLGDHAWLSARSTICGSAHIGARCFVGAGATVCDRVSVGAGCIVGAGALILDDCAEDGVYAAAPTPRRGPR
jgi:sugar O-acyltransferase (sialic acid O-acetyltransferase NeuD family)